MTDAPPGPLPFRRPWRIMDNGSSLRIEDKNGKRLCFVYYRTDGALREDYLTREEALALAQAIARLSRGNED